MKILKRKRIQVIVEFDSYGSLLDTLSKIVSDAQMNKQYDCATHHTSKHEWFQEYVNKEQPIREIERNNRIVQTFRSKMNRRKIEI